MEKKEAIWILENGAWWDSLPDDMSDADKNPLIAAIDAAVDALKMPEKREQLTMEQLREVPHGKIKDSTLQSICDRANEIACKPANIDRKAWGKPCKVGDKVFQQNGVDIFASQVKKIIYDCGHFAFDEEIIGERVFLDRESAEAALKGDEVNHG